MKRWWLRICFCFSKQTFPIWRDALGLTAYVSTSEEHLTGKGLITHFSIQQGTVTCTVPTLRRRWWILIGQWSPQRLSVAYSKRNGRQTSPNPLWCHETRRLRRFSVKRLLSSGSSSLATFGYNVEPYYPANTHTHRPILPYNLTVSVKTKSGMIIHHSLC